MTLQQELYIIATSKIHKDTAERMAEEARQKEEHLAKVKAAQARASIFCSGLEAQVREQASWA